MLIGIHKTAALVVSHVRRLVLSYNKLPIKMALCVCVPYKAAEIACSLIELVVCLPVWAG